MNYLERIAHKVVKAGSKLSYAKELIVKMREMIKENGGPVLKSLVIHNELESEYGQYQCDLEDLFIYRHNLQFKIGDDQKKFIKQIRRIEIKYAIEDLRKYKQEVAEALVVAGQLGYPTLDTYDYALAAEYVAAENTVIKLFKARNDFSFIGA